MIQPPGMEVGRAALPGTSVEAVGTPLLAYFLPAGGRVFYEHRLSELELSGRRVRQGSLCVGLLAIRSPRALEQAVLLKSLT